jgi:transposase
MAYSEDYRKRTVEYYHEGKTQSEVYAVFKIYPGTLRDWESRMLSGSLKPNYPKTRAPRKLAPDELLLYVEEHPDAFLTEIGEHFDCSDVAVGKALKKLGITRKKNAILQRAR